MTNRTRDTMVCYGPTGGAAGEWSGVGRGEQEREAEVEEERLRKEREAREQQDVMTLGETREQIQQLEGKLQQLKEEKHQLFLQLKKVLNEDDNRRRQLVKESNDMLTIQAIPSTGLVHQQLFIPQSVPRVTALAQQSFKAVNKRPRSPSPQPPPAPPTTIYHQGYAYKPPNVGNTAYQGSPQKTPQYPNQQGTFYPPQNFQSITLKVQYHLVNLLELSMKAQDRRLIT
ncbi:hypothetical protein FQR65_LT00803 [Abscondita terminalis]|nr:hypothetical protein FQR65_LT00803 [Abscondita terminalis]